MFKVVQVWTWSLAVKFHVEEVCHWGSLMLKNSEVDKVWKFEVNWLSMKLRKLGIEEVSSWYNLILKNIFVDEVWIGRSLKLKKAEDWSFKRFKLKKLGID